MLAASTNTITKLSLAGPGSAPRPQISAGPYLSSLEELEIKLNLASLEPALGATTRLRCLDLSQNRGLKISLGDVERVLSPLQQPTRLRLWNWSKAMDPLTTVHLFRSLPLLKPPSSWDSDWPDDL